MLSADLAARTGTSERYVREWLAAQAAGGFITYDAVTGRYTLPAEQALALADENSPMFLPGFFEIVEACVKDVPMIKVSAGTSTITVSSPAPNAFSAPTIAPT